MSFCRFLGKNSTIKIRILMHFKTHFQDAFLFRLMFFFENSILSSKLKKKRKFKNEKKIVNRLLSSFNWQTSNFLILTFSFVYKPFTNTNSKEQREFKKNSNDLKSQRGCFK
jgi:hypothetical protein